MIEVKKLSYTYPKSDTPAINELSFQIEKGKIFGFLGPNGSGKTTAQKVLFKLLTDYAGEAYIKNTEVKAWDKELYKAIGVCFELPNHYLKFTAKENLSFFEAFYGRSVGVEKVLEMVGLAEDADKKVSDFSKGMKMRLNFARSFLHDPEILFLDEPTSGLDPVNARVVKDIILDLKSQGKTIFITTHQMHDADELCDRIAFIVDGTIKICDKPESLKLMYGEPSVEVQFEDGEQTVFDLKGLGNNSQFLSSIAGKTVQTIHSKEASLDQVFLKVTGKALG